MAYDPSRSVEQAVGAATIAAQSILWRDPARRAACMRAVAAALRAEQREVLRAASDETNLTIDELKPELERAIGTLRMFADIAEKRAWSRAAIDRSRKTVAEAIGPNHDLRRMLIPLGDVVAVFGASNFPLAYGVCGGDTASAWGAGCTVVVKEHPGHPETGRLIARIARAAIAASGIDQGALGYVHDEDERGFAVAQQLVQHEQVCAVGFTGSIPGGLAVEKLARERETPIPVFAEMSSTNPVFVTAAALAERGEQIARELGQSLLARYGQQCTCPGLMLLGGDATAFKGAISHVVSSAPSRSLLTPRVRDNYVRRASQVGGYVPEVELLAQSLPSPDAQAAPATLFEVAPSELGLDFLTSEVFGPASIVSPLIGGLEVGRLEAMLESLRGQLTASIYTSLKSPEPPEVRSLIARLTRCVGRIIFNGPPTGVRVCHAMVHGGPFPATNRPDTTAVGPLAIERWCRPVCFQNAPQDLLPDELKDGNPLNITRTEDGVLVPAQKT